MLREREGDFYEPDFTHFRRHCLDIAYLGGERQMKRDRFPKPFTQACKPVLGHFNVWLLREGSPKYEN